LTQELQQQFLCLLQWVDEKCLDHCKLRIKKEEKLMPCSVKEEVGIKRVSLQLDQLIDLGLLKKAKLVNLPCINPHLTYSTLIKPNSL
jgi:hypothetical protein